MVDRAARDRLANDLWRLVNGEMTNDQFMDSDPDKSLDAGVLAIWEFSDSLYHDMYPYRLKGAHAVELECRDVAERAVLFLHSELEYEWPKEQGGVVPFWGAWSPGFYACLGVLLMGFTCLSGSALLAIFALVMFIYPVHWAVTRNARLNAERQFLASGDLDVWPFIRLDDLERARMREPIHE